MDATSFALRIAAFYTGAFGANGAHQPFFPVWLEGRGFDAAEISICIALPIAIRLFLQPVAGHFADRASSRALAITIFTSSAVLAFLPAWFAGGFWSILLFATVSGVVWSFVFPTADALALTGVRRFGLDYGRMRLAGSIAFMSTNLAAGGALALFGHEAIFWVIIGMMTVATMVSLILPRPPRPAPRQPGAAAVSASARAVLGHPALLSVMLAAALIQASHSVFYGFGAIHWQRLGLSGFEIGALWAVSILAEVVVLAFSGAFWRFLGARGLIALGGAAAVVRWSLFLLEPGFLASIPLQILHAFTFCATMLGVQRAIVFRVPEDMTGTAQAMYAVFIGGAAATGTIVSGPLFGALAGDAYAVMIIPAALGLAALVPFWRALRETAGGEGAKSGEAAPAAAAGADPAAGR